MTTLVMGVQWGDEGKGKLVDAIADKVQIVARAQGGHNCGHSVYKNGELFDFHQTPSGLLHPHVTNLIGAGCALHVPTLFSELETLQKKGIDTKGKLLISTRCQVNFNLYGVVDGLNEAALGSRSIGTTKRGIGPCFSAATARNGIRLAEVFDEAIFERKLRALVEHFTREFGDALDYDIEKELADFKEYRPKLREFCVDDVRFMKEAQAANKKILVEGAQATMLDNSYGTYPFVTSSSTTFGGCMAGLTIDHKKIDAKIGVMKAYTTRVGSGPFPSEDFSTIGQKLQKTGGEVGVSTGRTRRCGWLDLVVVKFSADINYYTSFNLTKLDVLDDFETLEVAVAYKDRASGEVLDYFPASADELEKVEVVYKQLPGWKTSTTGTKNFDDLPKAAQDYVKFIEDFTGVPVSVIGIGPNREDTIWRDAKQPWDT